MKKPALFGAILLAALAACGGSDHDGGLQSPPAVPPPSGGAAPDKFVAQVASVAATAPDATEPEGLDASAPTMPEDTEPAPIGP